MPKRKPPRKRAARAPAPPAPPAPPPPEPGSYQAWHGQLTPTEKRVDEIVQKMQSGAWLTGVSERALAKEWNTAPDTVRKLASEASRVIRLQLRQDPGAREEARAAVLQTFEVIRAKAMGKGDPASLRVALDATRALGFYLGVEPAKQLDVGRRPDPFDGWTPEEKLAFATDGSRPRRALRAAVSEANGHALPNGSAASDEPADGTRH